MNRYGVIPGILLTALAVLVILACTRLEIYPKKINRGYSREARTDEFLALKRWLAGSGHPSRSIRRGSASLVAEQDAETVFIQDSAFEWEDSGETLSSWISGGGSLIVSVETPPEKNALGTFLAGFGIRPDSPAVPERGYRPDIPVPDFDRLVKFTLDETAGPLGPELMRDENGLVSLVRIPLGKGSLTVIGAPRFMQNRHLEKEPNARLTWKLCGDLEEGRGPLFIRDRGQVKNLFGKLTDRGNLTPLLVSILVLILTGFWMIIPGFGVLKEDAAGDALSIGERFRAEAGFLKSWRALDKYLRVYLEELKYRGMEPEGEIKKIEEELAAKEKFSHKDIIRNLHLLMNKMERLCLKN
jgi:hypothetical protein